MNTPHLRLVSSDGLAQLSDAAQPDPDQALPLGQTLVAMGALSQDRLVAALKLQLTLNAPLGEIVVTEGWSSEADVQEALARQFVTRTADLAEVPPKPGLGIQRPGEFWMRHRALPWMRLGRTILVATARPERFSDLRADLATSAQAIIPVLTTRVQVETAIAEQFAVEMARAAETRLEAGLSARRWSLWHRVGVASGLGALALGLCLALPITLFALSVLAVLTMLLFAGLRVVALAAWLFPRRRPDLRPHPTVRRRPKVSILVPLFRETEIAGALVRRLCRLTYPKALLEVILVLEEHDEVTRQTLEHTDLPAWMRVVRVPGFSGLTTKPRAMNHALDFCQGEIVGVWDAEDAPAADQIERVVERFAAAPPEVVCLQGILDFYNPRTNWIARCFSIEYAAWFRVVMPALARFGLVVPLGGTTLFFRRDRLEELGRWDAHSVTEDADLGMRLCRAGWRTEMIDTTTYEEATCRPWGWIKQRSRWLKGFMVTYLIHMRSPLRLWRDLGARRFASFQAFFLGTICQFMLAPVLWSYWLIVLGLGHPVQSLVADWLLVLGALAFLTVELISALVACMGVCRAGRSFLLPWVVLMPFYYVLGALGAAKAVIELVVAPHYWDKTRHGLAEAEPAPPR